jgi:hypothetical protein
MLCILDEMFYLASKDPKKQYTIHISASAIDIELEPGIDKTPKTTVVQAGGGSGVLTYSPARTAVLPPPLHIQFTVPASFNGEFTFQSAKAQVKSGKVGFRISAPSALTNNLYSASCEPVQPGRLSGSMVLYCGTSVVEGNIDGLSLTMKFVGV